MPRPASSPTTRLGQLLQGHRGSQTGAEAATAAGLSEAAWYRWERGAHTPSGSAARALARVLGISTDEVLDAAERPPLPPDDEPTLDPGPIPRADLHAAALRLPEGATLKPWAPAGGGKLLIRDGAGPLKVAASEVEAWCSVPGLEYRDRTPGRSLVERRDALDAFLVEKGAAPTS